MTPIMTAFALPLLLLFSLNPTVSSLALTDTAEANVQQLITGKVNRFRRTVDASNMLEIRWDFEARQLAQKFTDRCDFRPPRGAKNQAAFLKTQKYTCGLDMARGTGKLGWNETLEMWFDGRKDFQYGVDTKKAVGQYTALIWAKTFSLGCGYTQCKKDTPQAFDFFACMFCPAGNTSPDQFTPYAQGDRCGACPQACSDGLCTNPCLEVNEFSNCDTELFPAGCSGVDQTSPLAPFLEKCKATCRCKPQGLLY